MSAEQKVVELVLIPIPPALPRSEIVALIEQTLRDAGYENLLANQDIRIVPQQDTPLDPDTIRLLLEFATLIAIETYKALILPKLKERFQVKEEEKE